MAGKTQENYYRDFQEGTFLVKGWKARMAEILKTIPQQDQEATRARLEALGENIGWEWAKDNAIRRIDTAMLRKWGDRLMNARKQGTQALLSEIGNIEMEVKDILG